MAALLLASDGNFYGNAMYGGADKSGVIYRLTPPLAGITLELPSKDAQGLTTSRRAPPS